jgi:hypothetical protein
MATNPKVRPYAFSAYDKYLCLKMSIPMWLTVLFLARPFAIMLMSIVNRRDRMGLVEMFYGDPVAMAIDSFAALPALLVLFALARRQPGASETVRWIWTHGRILLILATALNIFSVFIPFLWESATRMHTPELVKLAASILILVFLFRSPRVRDTFSDFPEPVSDDS